MNYTDNHIELVRRLRVYQSGERRAPHKPLLLLIAIAKLLKGQREIPFGEIEETLRPLLDRYAPPVVGRHQPELPYWHLQTDGLWEIPGADSLPRQAGGFPQMAALRASFGRLQPDLAEALSSNSDLVLGVINTILDEHFTPSIHEDILVAVGLELPMQAGVADRSEETAQPQRRDPRFSKAVLRAYEHRCAVTGFRAAIGGRYFGCEAAHVKWLSQNGPNTVDNGFAVEPTLHKLFDVGAWTLTDDRRILVSADFTGDESTVSRIRDLHGTRIRPPLSGEPEVSVEFIRWHRLPELGGVFRHPALGGA